MTHIKKKTQVENPQFEILKYMWAMLMDSIQVKNSPKTFSKDRPVLLKMGVEKVETTLEPQFCSLTDLEPQENVSPPRAFITSAWKWK